MTVYASTAIGLDNRISSATFDSIGGDPSPFTMLPGKLSG